MIMILGRLPASLCLVVALASAGGPSADEAAGLKISNRLSPLNSRRPVRPATRYIILHTTEGGETSALNEVRRYGETHYFVTPAGRVYRIIERHRIATHAGRSMWAGVTGLDNYSVGIEVVGRYDRDITAAQYEALRELLRQLKSLYRIPDENVLTHSMVAYGRPNRFHPHNHRGRKRCGMIFARPDVRERLGLHARPERDPDVDAGRLKVADAELQRYLYMPVPAASADARVAEGGSAEAGAAAGEAGVITPGVNAWSIARERYNRPDTLYIFPNGDRVPGDRIADWNRIPAGTRVQFSGEEREETFEGFMEIGRDGDTVRQLAGEAWAESSTIYFFPDGLIRTGSELARNAAGRALLENPPRGTRVLVGYTYGGYVQTRRPPVRIAGRKWNYPSTFYRLPDGRILSGDEVDDKAIPARTLVFYQN
jgi:N-acetylmuramoyl-L-alanine amidase